MLAPLVTLSFAVGLAQAAVPTPGDMRHSVAPLVDRVKGSVVTIQSTKVVRRMVREDVWGELFGMAPRARRETQQGLGSGFLIDRNGTVLTNNHVIAGAEELRVVLADGRVLDATLVGADPDTDVAVVQIRRPPADLRPVALGDSERVRVGDYVLAIGNPLGLGQTVTMGIVSAKNRVLDGRLIELEDFIQTDAAINQGNSGGPLFNFEGEVVGVNSAILNPAMAMNVGFAIPINLARQVATQLQKTGRASRGYLGAITLDLTPELARSLGVPFGGGAVVQEVISRSPAEQAGLRPNDVIVEIAGRRIDGRRRLGQVIAAQAPGTNVSIVYLRRGARLEGQAELTENVALSGTQVFGVYVKQLTGREQEELGLSTPAFRVMGVDPRSQAGPYLREGDLIIGIDRQLGVSLERLRAVEAKLKRGGESRLIISRGGYPFALRLTG
jgi:Do/DeqQ family serine protease